MHEADAVHATERLPEGVGEADAEVMDHDCERADAEADWESVGVAEEHSDTDAVCDSVWDAEAVRTGA